MVRCCSPRTPGYGGCRGTVGGPSRCARGWARTTCRPGWRCASRARTNWSGPGIPGVRGRNARPRPDPVERRSSTWTPVARQGESDFHSVSVSGDTIAAAEGAEATAYATDDGGRSFESRATPLALVDLEIDPGSPSRWMGSTQTGLFSSDDGGEAGAPRNAAEHPARVAVESLAGPGRSRRRGAPQLRRRRDVGRRRSRGGETQALAAAGPRTRSTPRMSRA